MSAFRILKNKNSKNIDTRAPENPIDGTCVWLPLIFENDKPVLRGQSEWALKDARSGQSQAK
jgi:hypothetical protein